MALLECRSPLLAIAEDFAKLPPALQAIVAEKAITQQSGSKKVEPTSEQISNQLMKPEAVRLWIWRLARNNHPDLTTADLETSIATEADAIEALALLNEATGVKDAYPNSNGRT